MSAIPEKRISTADVVSAGQGHATRAPDEQKRDSSQRAAPAPESPDSVHSPPRPARAEAPREAPAAERNSALLPPDESGDFRHRWDGIQTGFVDEPRRAVEEADHLVAQAMKRVAEVFAEERAGLESQWSQGGDVSTEDLRLALKRYRAFFDRLLSV